MSAPSLWRLLPVMLVAALTLTSPFWLTACGVPTSIGMALAIPFAVVTTGLFLWATGMLDD